MIDSLKPSNTSNLQKVLFKNDEALLCHVLNNKDYGLFYQKNNAIIDFFCTFANQSPIFIIDYVISIAQPMSHKHLHNNSTNQYKSFYKLLNMI